MLLSLGLTEIGAPASFRSSMVEAIALRADLAFPGVYDASAYLLSEEARKHLQAAAAAVGQEQGQFSQRTSGVASSQQAQVGSASQTGGHQSQEGGSQHH